jgi:septal ring factor EnvC (AmiA/AmiB activator)
MKEHMNKFFQMSQEEQNKFLDNMIAQHERMRKMREAREAQRAQNGSNNNRRQDGPPRGNHKAMLQGMLENTDSTSRAQMAEFHRRMEARRKATQGK